MVECPWPIDIDECAKKAGIDPETTEGAAKVADVKLQVTEMMHRWSGGVFGGCTTVRPLEPCGTCRNRSCCAGDCIMLHGVSGVIEVRMYGEAVPATDYHFDPSYSTLCAGPGLVWPISDPRYVANGSLEVDVNIGTAPDAWALSVANELACEMLAALTGAKCRLPLNAVSATGQGISVNFRQDDAIYALPNLMSWVNTINPARATQRSVILSPELDQRGGRGYARAPWHRR